MSSRLLSALALYLSASVVSCSKVVGVVFGGSTVRGQNDATTRHLDVLEWFYMGRSLLGFGTL